jgi:hypothetical protein
MHGVMRFCREYDWTATAVIAGKVRQRQAHVPKMSIIVKIKLATLLIQRAFLLKNCVSQSLVVKSISYAQCFLSSYFH